MVDFGLDRVENILGKGENAGYQCFQKAASPGLLKADIVWQRLTLPSSPVSS